MGEKRCRLRAISMGLPHFGIVIQGPLDSRGFDTRLNILEYLAQADALPQFRFTFCLSTWPGAELGSLAPAAERLQVLWNTPPPGRDYENRRRQIVSALAGVRQLAIGEQPDFLLKVRTDQWLSLEQFAGIYSPCRRRRAYLRDCRRPGGLGFDPVPRPRLLLRRDRGRDALFLREHLRTQRGAMAARRGNRLRLEVPRRHPGYGAFGVLELAAQASALLQPLARPRRALSP